MDPSKTRTVLLKKLIRNGASCGYLLPSLVALRPSNWNIGRWNEAKSEVRRTFRLTKYNGKGSNRSYQTTNSCRSGEPRATRRDRARTARRQHHGLLQGV